MNNYQWQAALGALLVIISAALYWLQLSLFNDARNTAFYLLQDVAFVPIQVLLVTLILNQLLTMREKDAMLNKMNMVIGTFFSEVGSPLLVSFIAFDRNADAIRPSMLVTSEWNEKRFIDTMKQVEHMDLQIRYDAGDVDKLKSLLASKRDFLLGLLENPNLLEHETFTDLLWAVFHLNEELAVRGDLAGLPQSDSAHIAGDMKRAYSILIVEWLAYMKHLKREYPYLFSYAVRMNPFDPNASPVVK